jgi:hypothetical protein
MYFTNADRKECSFGIVIAETMGAQPKSRSGESRIKMCRRYTPDIQSCNARVDVILGEVHKGDRFQELLVAPAANLAHPSWIQDVEINCSPTACLAPLRRNLLRFIFSEHPDIVDNKFCALFDLRGVLIRDEVEDIEIRRMRVRGEAPLEG